MRGWVTSSVADSRLPAPYARFWILLLLLLSSGCSGQLGSVAFPGGALPVAPTASAWLPAVYAAGESSAAEAAVSAPIASAVIVPSTTPTPLPSATPRPSPSPTAVPTPCATPGQIVSGTYDSLVNGVSRYRIYLPPCYGQDGLAYPTLYMLPGNIHTDSIWDDLGLDEEAESAINEKRMPPVLIVMADGGTLANYTSGGAGSYESLILDDLIPYVERTYCAWPEGAGRAIGGVSRGGYWALEIAFRHPELFASVGGHSAALVDNFAGPAINPEFTGLQNELGSLRIYFDIGADDWLINNVRRLHEEMEAAGIAHTWVLNEGRHEDAYWSAHVADYLAWYAAAWSMDQEMYPACDQPQR